MAFAVVPSLVAMVVTKAVMTIFIPPEVLGALVLAAMVPPPVHVPKIVTHAVAIVPEKVLGTPVAIVPVCVPMVVTYAAVMIIPEEGLLAFVAVAPFLEGYRLGRGGGDDRHEESGEKNCSEGEDLHR